MRRRRIPVPHREFFRAVMIDETVALACTCPRGVDHWYAEPQTTTGSAESADAAGVTATTEASRSTGPAEAETETAGRPAAGSIAALTADRADAEPARPSA